MGIKGWSGRPPCGTTVTSTPWPVPESDKVFWGISDLNNDQRQILPTTT